MTAFFSVNPIPSNLKSESKKAAKILREFTEITSRNGPDIIIPVHVIAKAQGLAILSVIKAGFLVTARGGSGILVGRLPDGSKSFIGFFKKKVVSDLVIILNHNRAVKAFAKGGNLTLGGNFTVAIGPLGRNMEADVALRSTAAVYTYCRSRGLFAGISLEGSCLIERKETNRKFYCQEIRACAILFGDVEPPSVAQELYEILATFTEQYQIDEQQGKKKNVSRMQPKAGEPGKPRSRPQRTRSAGNEGLGGNSWDNPLVVTALHSFEGQAPCDLDFKAGDRITVTSQTDSQFDWWEGTLRGKIGIFPANYVSLSMDSLY
uniref:SH3 domain-containing YSC84-like protein 1 n=1 Tax=Callorhinchus milii TaxID=7868 RepID=A0A4W3JEL0_CALMI